MSKEVSVKISDRLYIKHALMFVFSDVFVNYVREFESEVNASGFKFKHDVKYHFNSFLKFLAQSKKEVSLFMEGMLLESPDFVVDNVFEDSDAFNDLFKLMVDRIVGESENKEVYSKIYSYVYQTFKSSNLFWELPAVPENTEQFCCDMVHKCPLARSNKADANGYQYSVYYCRGMFKNCARRKIRMVEGMQAVPETLLPDGTHLPDGESVFRL